MRKQEDELEAGKDSGSLLLPGQISVNKKLSILLGVYQVATMRRKFFLMSHLTLSHAIVNSHLRMLSHRTEEKLSIRKIDRLGIQLFLNLPGAFSFPSQACFHWLPNAKPLLQKTGFLSGQIKPLVEERAKKTLFGGELHDMLLVLKVAVSSLSRNNDLIQRDEGHFGISGISSCSLQKRLSI